MKLLTKKKLQVLIDKAYHRGFYEAFKLPKTDKELAKVGRR